MHLQDLRTHVCTYVSMADSKIHTYVVDTNLLQWHLYCTVIILYNNYAADMFSTKTVCTYVCELTTLQRTHTDYTYIRMHERVVLVVIFVRHVGNRYIRTYVLRI